ARFQALNLTNPDSSMTFNDTTSLTVNTSTSFNGAGGTATLTLNNSASFIGALSVGDSGVGVVNIQGSAQPLISGITVASNPTAGTAGTVNFNTSASITFNGATTLAVGA